jgi:hypothetical protein
MMLMPLREECFADVRLKPAHKKAGSSEILSPQSLTHTSVPDEV